MRRNAEWRLAARIRGWPTDHGPRVQSRMDLASAPLMRNSLVCGTRAVECMRRGPALGANTAPNWAANNARPAFRISPRVDQGNLLSRTTLVLPWTAWKFGFGWPA